MFNPALAVAAITMPLRLSKNETMEENSKAQEMQPIPMPDLEAADEFREKPQEVTPAPPAAAVKKKEEEDIDEELDDEDFRELEEDNRSIGEKLDDLAKEHFATGLEIIRKKQKGKRVSNRTLDNHAELGKHIRNLQTMYSAMVKLGRIEPNKDKRQGEKDFDKGVIDKIKKKHSSIGNVALQIPQENK